MLTSCLVDSRASLSSTLMELCALENRQHEIRVSYTGFGIAVADVKIKRPPASEVLQRKSTCQFDFLWTRLFYCTKYSTVYPTKWNYMWARHGSRHTVKYTWWPVSGFSAVCHWWEYVWLQTCDTWQMNLHCGFCILMLWYISLRSRECGYHIKRNFSYLNNFLTTLCSLKLTLAVRVRVSS